MTRSSPSHLLLIVLTAAYFAMTAANFACAQTWSAANPGELSDGTNWSGGIAPNATNATATISTQPTNSGGFTLTGSLTWGTLNYSNSQNLVIGGTGTLTLSTTTDTPTISLIGSNLKIINVITGSNGLQKTGSGILTLTGNNRYTGNTIVVGGGALNTGEVDGNTIGDQGLNSTFGRGNFNLSNFGAISYTGGNAATNRTITVGTGGGAVGVSNASTTLNLVGLINGGGDFIKLGSGTLLLSASNSYSGNTNISGGTLQLAASERIPDASAVSISNAGSTLNLDSNNETIGSLANTDSNATVLLGSGKLTTGGNNGSTTYSGSIGGTGSLVKTGSGTMTLSGASSYSGGTTISAGILLANNSTGSATGTAQVTVNSGGTLGGTGAVTGSVMVNSGGTLAPGASIGALSAASLTFNANSTFSVEMDTSASLSVAADLLSSSGSLTIVNGALLSLANASPSTGVPVGTKFTLISYMAGTWNNGTFVGLPDDSSFQIGTNAFVINYNDTTAGVNFGGGAALGNSYLTLTAVPEAPPILFGALVCTGAALYTRYRKLRPSSAIS